MATALCAGAAFAQIEPILPVESNASEPQPGPSALEPDIDSALADLPDVPPPPPMTPVAVLVLDPGHGGNDAGATGVGGTLEKAVALSVAQRLQTMLLEAVPGQVLLTRTEDVDRTDAARVKYADSEGAGLFIALHTGASYAPTAQGVEVFYHQPTLTGRTDSLRGSDARDEAKRLEDSRRLSANIADAVALSCEATNRGTHGVASRVLGHLTCPAVLVELGCLTNPADEAKLADEDYHDRLAQGIAAGVLHFMDPGHSPGAAP